MSQIQIRDNNQSVLANPDYVQSTDTSALHPHPVVMMATSPPGTFRALSTV